jgi:hypothetical protein
VPTDLPLPNNLKADHWKVKIREKEVLEPPHVTIVRRTDAWRINLRTGEFMDARPKPDTVPEELLTLIQTHWEWLKDSWNEKYPNNPVEGNKDETDV